MIDIHTHLGSAGRKRTDSLTPDEMILAMDSRGISVSVVLPLHDSPSGWYRATTEDVIGYCNRFPGRLIPFCQIDPRFGDNSPETDFSDTLVEYKERGCRGVGEITASMLMDDPMVRNLFRQCGEAEMPVLFHAAHKVGGTYGLVDELGMPKLEALLKDLPGTTIIAHGPAFWSEISADVSAENRGGYPEGPVKAPGRAEVLLTAYPNLYGDLSAGSGFNAIARDPEFGYAFLERCAGKLLFGTDFLGRGQEVPIVEFMKEALAGGKISPKAHRQIAHDNAARLLRLG